MTIPRLELSAATVAVKLDRVLKRELEICVDKSVFWTDSTAVIKYINNESKRFQTFVANRIAVIKDGSDASQWNYVQTKMNPADDASRGVSANDLVGDSRWIKGPAFLWQSKEAWKEAVKEAKQSPQPGPCNINGLLCVGGRLKHLPTEESNMKYPVILPKRNHMVDLIIRYYHDLSGHLGKEHVLSLVRERVSDDARDPNALTPNHLLMLKSNECDPPGIFSNKDSYSKKRWKQIQYLADLFWKRWVKEYLPTLQQRQKWLTPKRNLRENDIVLIVEKPLPRGAWRLGRVIDVHIGRDGLVRSAKVKTSQSELVRPVDKLCLLEGSAENPADDELCTD
eukprot:gene19621-biopygen13890